jgi:hypothetical protein
MSEEGRVGTVLETILEGMDGDILGYLTSMIAENPSMDVSEMSVAIGPFLESCEFIDNCENARPYCEKIVAGLLSGGVGMDTPKQDGTPKKLETILSIAENVKSMVNIESPVQNLVCGAEPCVKQLVQSSFEQFVEEKDVAKQVATLFLTQHLHTTKHGVRLARRVWEKDGLQAALHTLCTQPEVSKLLSLEPAWLVDSLTAAMAEEMVSNEHWKVASQGMKTKTAAQRRRKGRRNNEERAGIEKPGLIPGMFVFALLREDDAWHPAEIASTQLGNDQACVAVEFLEYGRMQRSVPRAQLVLEEEMPNSDDESEDKEGCCKLCQRIMPLTFHHLIPRATHTKMLHTFDRWTMRQRGIDICRPCHNTVHKTWDEMELAMKYNTLELLLATEQIQQFLKYARSQKTVSKDDAVNHKLQYRR